MKRHIVVALALIALALSGCAVGTGRLVTETREVSGFDRVILSGVGQLNVTQGDHESLTIEAESNVMRRIETQVRGGTLYIEVEVGFPGGVIPTRGIAFDLTMKEIAGLSNSGAGSIVADAIETDHLEIKISGAGNVAIQHLRGETLEVGLSGVGSCTVSGQVTEQRANLSGVGSYKAGDLESERATVTVSGTGSATVWATETLDARISGIGSVQYYGNPHVSQSVSGIGSIKGQGPK